MTIASLSSSAMSGQAILGLHQATEQITASAYRLATGNRFYRAGDDVAALSIAARLQSDLSGFRSAQQNNAQATSLLQVAYGGLSDISSILDDMQGLATQADSGSLTAVERAALDLEFQELRAEIDRIANNTNFNGIYLLDGSTSQENDVATTTTNATQASGSILFTANPGAGQTINVNGLSVVAGTDFVIGGTTAITASNFANFLSTSTDSRVSGASYLAAGSQVNITSKPGGKLGEQFLINEAASTAAASFVVSGQATAVANVFALQSAQNNGLKLGGTVVTGTVGDSLVNSLSQTQASQTLFVTSNAGIANNQTIQIDDGTAGGTINFRARSAALALPEDFLIGATAEETLQNFVATASQYSTNSDFVLNQLEYEISGDQLTIRGQLPGNILDQTGANASVNETTGGTTFSGTSLNNGTNTGINTSGVVNPDFVGTISGFSATYNSADNITASITVGSNTYTAQITDTTPGANTFYRFNSTSGGYFDVEISAAGLTVNNQANADTFANRLDAAFATLNVYQSRTISNFTGVGQLAGATAELRTDDFSNVQIDDITVTDATSGAGEAGITIDVNGEQFSNSQLGQSIGAYETVTLRSQSDSNRFIRITNGATVIDLSNSTNAATFQNTLDTNFDLTQGGGAISFQTGLTADDNISVEINRATSDSLFNGATPDLLSQPNAAAAITTIDDALNEIGTIIATVGSAQARLGYASSALDNTVTQFELAHSSLADTDIPSEATLFASAIVQQQSAIAVLAQTQLLGNNLVDLLKTH